METTEKIPKGDIQKKMKRIKEWYYQKKKKKKNQQRKTVKEEKRLKKPQDRNKQLTNSNSKFFSISYYFKCIWIKLSNQKTQTG